MVLRTSQTQGKIESWLQTLKNRILLENHFLTGDLEAQVAAFVERYNHRRYHESLDNLTPTDVYFGDDDAGLFGRIPLAQFAKHCIRAVASVMIIVASSAFATVRRMECLSLAAMRSNSLVQ